jgi:hypothetical protein
MNSFARAIVVLLILMPALASAQQPVTMVQAGGTAVPLAAGGSGDVDSDTTRVVFANDGMSLTNSWITTTSSTNAKTVRAAAARLFSVAALNPTTTTYYLKLYNVASMSDCSTTTGWVASLPIAPTPTSGQVGGWAIPFGPLGFAFPNGIGACVVGGSANNDNTNAAAGIIVMIGAK